MKWSSRTSGWIAPDRAGARDGRSARRVVPCPTRPADLADPILDCHSHPESANAND
ncbi:hypothetical protein T261_3415 [Streptomyces lydicus]|nr:hypothetical protein T261_3415 [Streptomyces lydicus]